MPDLMLEPVEKWSDEDPTYEEIVFVEDEDSDLEDDIDLTEAETEPPTDAPPLEPYWAAYELYGRNLDELTSWTRLATEEYTGDLEVAVDGLTAGARWEFRIRLIDQQGRYSPYSDPLQITLPTDFTPPPRPTAPWFDHTQGWVTLGWNGQLMGEIPRDFSHVLLMLQQMHPEGDPDGEEGDPYQVARFAESGEWGTSKLPQAEHRAFLVAVDTTGNRSPWSDTVTFTPTLPVNREEIEDRIRETEEAIEAGLDSRDTELRGEIITRSGTRIYRSVEEPDGERAFEHPRLTTPGDRGGGSVYGHAYFGMNIYGETLQPIELTEGRDYRISIDTHDLGRENLSYAGVAIFDVDTSEWGAQWVVEDPETDGSFSRDFTAEGSRYAIIIMAQGDHFTLSNIDIRELDASGSPVGDNLFPDPDFENIFDEDYWALNPADGWSVDTGLLPDNTRWEQWSSLEDGGQLLATWTLAAGEWVEGELSEQYIPRIAIGQGTYGELEGERLKARSIQTYHLLVGDRSNLVDDPHFERFGEEDSFWAPNTVDSWVAVEASGVSSVPYLRLSGGATDSDAPTRDGTAYGLYFGTTDEPVPAEPGESYVLEWRKLRWSPVEEVEYNANVSFVDSTGAHMSWHGRTHFTGDQGYSHGNVCSLQFEMPSGAAGFRLYWRMATTGGSLGMDSPSVRKMVKATMIVDGEILARHVHASEEMSAKLAQFLEVRADHMTANAIDGMTITGAIFQTHTDPTRGIRWTPTGLTVRNGAGEETLSINAVNGNVTAEGGTFTGAHFQTDAQGSRGVSLWDQGLTAWDESGNRTFHVQRGSGNVTATGTFQTHQSGRRVAISPTSPEYSRPTIRLATGDTSDIQPTLQATSNTDSGFPGGSVVLHGREVTANSSGRLDLIMEPGYQGGMSLRRQHGSFSGIGFYIGSGANGEARQAYIRGRANTGIHPQDHTVYGNSGPYVISSSGRSYRVSFTYPQPPEAGSRFPQVTPQVSGAAADNWNSVNSSTYDRSASGFSVLTRKDPDTTGSQRTFYLRYAAVWI